MEGAYCASKFAVEGLADVLRGELRPWHIDVTVVEPGPTDTGLPCDYLGPTGCAFPTDLRPFGCAAFICIPMRRLLDPESLITVEQAVAALESAHAELMDALHAG